MLTWPDPAGDFADFARINQAFISLAKALAQAAPVYISLAAALDIANLRQAIGITPHPVHCQHAPVGDVWVRDHGPIGVYDKGRVRLLKFEFDGWGGKYPSQNDNALLPWLVDNADFAHIHDLETQGWVLEGGGVETDGQGTLLATTRSVLDPKRNPELSVAMIEDKLRASLGIKRFHWLEHGGLAGDDTDGHIDTLVRFVAPGVLVYQGAPESEGPNSAELQAMAEELAQWQQANGQAYELHALPHTQQAHTRAPTGLPSSYSNFLFINDFLLVPQYSDPADSAALELLRNLCPQHRVEGVDCSALVEQYGGLHCATMNIPLAHE
nr:agmatine deiminase family protein [Oceanococcus sp. HetDA_MAG_MS8]